MSKTLKLNTKIDVTAPVDAGAGKITFESGTNLDDRGAIRAEVLALDAAETVLEEKTAILVMTREELLAALKALGPDPSILDPTMDLPTGEIPAHLIADKAALPPPEERKAAFTQAPAAIHGSFGINGIPMIAPGVIPANIDIATGRPFVQANMPVRTQISPPPSRRFDGR